MRAPTSGALPLSDATFRDCSSSRVDHLINLLIFAGVVVARVGTVPGPALFVEAPTVRGTRERQRDEQNRPTLH